MTEITFEDGKKQPHDNEETRQAVMEYLLPTDKPSFQDWRVKRYVETGNPADLSTEQKIDRLLFLNIDGSLDTNDHSFARTPEGRQKLWDALSERVAYIDRERENGHHGSHRGPGYYSHNCLDAIVEASYTQHDGTEHVYIVKAVHGQVKRAKYSRWEDGVVSSYTMYTSNNDAFWSPRALAYDGKPPIVICDGTYYTVGQENNDQNSFKGFGGHAWYFQLVYPLTVDQYTEEMPGEIFCTTNLWHGGKIPPYWREHGLHQNVRKLTKEEFDECKEAGQKVLNPNDFARKRVNADMVTPEQHRAITS